MMTSAMDKLSVSGIHLEEDALIDFQFAILDAMRARGVSQSELASLLGVSKARVSQMLSSEANPTIKSIGRVLHALDLKVVYARRGALVGGSVVEKVNKAKRIVNAGAFEALADQMVEIEFAWGLGGGRHDNENSPEHREAA